MKVLEIKSLNTYYGESHILRDVDLTVNSGEMVTGNISEEGEEDPLIKKSVKKNIKNT